MNIKFHDMSEVKDDLIKIAVIVAKHQGKWVFCKHKHRNTWEVPGGHREEGETILQAAKRELYEETGAIRYDIRPVTAYSITRYAMLYYAEISEFEELPDSEIALIQLFDHIPEDLTYPQVHPELINKVIEELEIM